MALTLQKVQSTHWTNYCNELYSAATYMQLCQRSIYVLVVGKCVYREKWNCIIRQSNHMGWHVIRVHRGTRDAGAILFLDFTDIKLEARDLQASYTRLSLCKPGQGTGGNPVQPSVGIRARTATQPIRFRGLVCAVPLPTKLSGSPWHQKIWPRLYYTPD